MANKIKKSMNLGGIQKYVAHIVILAVLVISGLGMYLFNEDRNVPTASADSDTLVVDWTTQGDRFAFSDIDEIGYNNGKMYLKEILTTNTEYTFDGSMADPDIAFLTPTKFVIAFNDSTPGGGKAVIGDISGTTITYGSLYEFESNSVSSVDGPEVIAISSSSFVIVYEDRNDFKTRAIAGSVSGNVITFGTAAELHGNALTDNVVAAHIPPSGWVMNTIATTLWVLAPIDTPKVDINLSINGSDTLSVTGDSSDLNIALADTTASNNSEANILAAIQALGDVGGGVDYADFTVDVFGPWDTTAPGGAPFVASGTILPRFISAFSDDPYLYAKQGSVDGTTITVETELQTVDDNSAGSGDTKNLDMSHVYDTYTILTWINDDDNVSGSGDSVDAVSVYLGEGGAMFGSDARTVEVDDEDSSYDSAVTGLSNQRFIAIWEEDEDIKAKVGQIGVGAVITLGNEMTWSTSRPNENMSVVAIDDDKFVIQYEDDGDSDHGKFLMGETEAGGTQIDRFSERATFSATNTTESDIDSTYTLTKTATTTWAGTYRADLTDGKATVASESNTYPNTGPFAEITNYSELFNITNWDTLTETNAVTNGGEIRYQLSFDTAGTDYQYCNGGTVTDATLITHSSTASDWGACLSSLPQKPSNPNSNLKTKAILVSNATGFGSGTSTNAPQIEATNFGYTFDQPMRFMNAAYSADATSYELGTDTIYIQFEQTDADTTGGVDNVSVTLTNSTSGDSESVTLTETGATTGIFQGSITTAQGSATASNGTLEGSSGDTVKAINVTGLRSKVAIDDFENPAYTSFVTTFINGGWVDLVVFSSAVLVSPGSAPQFKHFEIPIDGTVQTRGSQLIRAAAETIDGSTVESLDFLSPFRSVNFKLNLSDVSALDATGNSTLFTIGATQVQSQNFNVVMQTSNKADTTNIGVGVSRYEIPTSDFSGNDTWDEFTIPLADFETIAPASAAEIEAVPLLMFMPITGTGVGNGNDLTWRIDDVNVGELFYQDTATLTTPQSVNITNNLFASISTIEAGTDIYFEVNDTSKDTTGGADTVDIIVQGTSSGDKETITLTETGGSTGLFRSSGIPTNNLTVSTEDGTLQLSLTDTVDARHLTTTTVLEDFESYVSSANMQASWPDAVISTTPAATLGTDNTNYLQKDIESATNILEVMANLKTITATDFTNKAVGIDINVDDPTLLGDAMIPGLGATSEPKIYIANSGTPAVYEFPNSDFTANTWHSFNIFIDEFTGSPDLSGINSIGLLAGAGNGAFQTPTTEVVDATDNGGNIEVGSTAGFAASGTVVIGNTDVATYTSTTGTSFEGVSGIANSNPISTGIYQTTKSGNDVTVKFDNFTISDFTTDTISSTAPPPLSITESDFSTAATTVLQGDSLYLRHEEPSRAGQGKVRIRVTSKDPGAAASSCLVATCDDELIDLTETGSSTGIFTGSMTTATAGTTRTHDNNTLEGVENDVVKAELVNYTRTATVGTFGNNLVDFGPIWTNCCGAATSASSIDDATDDFIDFHARKVVDDGGADPNVDGLALGHFAGSPYDFTDNGISFDARMSNPSALNATGANFGNNLGGTTFSNFTVVVINDNGGGPSDGAAHIELTSADFPAADTWYTFNAPQSAFTQTSGFSAIDWSDIDQIFFFVATGNSTTGADTNIDIDNVVMGAPLTTEVDSITFGAAAASGGSSAGGTTTTTDPETGAIIPLCSTADNVMNLTATIVTTSEGDVVDLTWDHSANIPTSIELKRGGKLDTTPGTMDSIMTFNNGDISYTDNTVSDGNVYHYAVVAKNSCGDITANAPVVQVTLPPALPLGIEIDMDVNITVKTSSASDNEIVDELKELIEDAKVEAKAKRAQFAMHRQNKPRLAGLLAATTAFEVNAAPPEIDPFTCAGATDWVLMNEGIDKVGSNGFQVEQFLRQHADAIVHRDFFCALGFQEADLEPFFDNAFFLREAVLHAWFSGGLAAFTPNYEQLNIVGKDVIKVRITELVQKSIDALGAKNTFFQNFSDSGLLTIDTATLDDFEDIIQEESLKETILELPEINTLINGHKETFTLQIWEPGNRSGTVAEMEITTNIFGEAELELLGFTTGVYDFTIKRPQALRKALTSIPANTDTLNLDFTRGLGQAREAYLKIGDFNDDGEINALDFAAVAGVAGGTDTSGLDISDIDLSGDGEINLSDFLEIIQNWGSDE